MYILLFLTCWIYLRTSPLKISSKVEIKDDSTLSFSWVAVIHISEQFCYSHIRKKYISLHLQLKTMLYRNWAYECCRLLFSKKPKAVPNTHKVTRFNIFFILKGERWLQTWKKYNRFYKFLVTIRRSATGQSLMNEFLVNI